MRRPASKSTGRWRPDSLQPALGRTQLFPRPLRWPAAMLVCAVECALGIALTVTAPAAARNGTGALDGAAADGARIAASAFFLVAMSALIELRGRRPDVGCGCFGDLSVRPVGARSIARSALLAVAALASIGGPRPQPPPPAPGPRERPTRPRPQFLVIPPLSP